MNRTSIILVGTSNLLYSCARIIKTHYGNDADIKVIDIAYSPMSRKYQDEFGRTDEFASKEEVFGYLDTIQTPTFILSVNFPYLFPDRFAFNPMLTLINLHHALLPNHPGRNAEAWAIYEQDAVAGVTWHYISGPGVDTGEIICQKSTELTEATTSLVLLKKCEALAKEGLQSILPLENLRFEDAVKQPKNVSYTPRKAREVPNDGYMDLNWSADKISAFLRALDYGIISIFPKPKCVFENTEFEIIKYTITPGFDKEPSILLEKQGDNTYIIVNKNAINIKMKVKN